MFRGKIIALALALSAAQVAGQAVEIGPRDWPMLAHDVRRTGATTDEVNPPVKRLWVRYFHAEGLMPSVQPVVVAGRVYVGTLAGGLYCLDADSGADVWKADVGAPVFHTACVAPEGVVVFGCGDGMVRALRCADGAEAWSYQTGAPLWNAPLAHEGRIYIGGRDGVFYCLGAADGKLAWKYDAGRPICQSPALDPQRAAVYFTSEDMVVHALDAATGERKWRSEQLDGTTARSFSAVVAPDGTVFTSCIPYYSWDRARQPLEKTQAELFGTEELDQSASRQAGTYTKITSWRHTKETNDRFDKHTREIFLKPDYFKEFIATLTRHVRDDPAARCLFALDPETGREKFFIPVLYTAFAKSAFTPPMVTPDGKVITKYMAFLPSTYHSYQREVNLAFVDTASGRLSPVFDESRVDSGRGAGLIADESCQLSVLGTRLVNIHNHNGEVMSFFDLTDPKQRTAGQYYTTHSHWWGVGIIHRILRGEIDKIAPGQEDLTKGFGVGNPGELATGNHTAANMPVVAAGGRLFYTSSGKLMCLDPAAKAPDFKRSERLSDYGIKPLSNAELAKLYDTWPINWDYVDLLPPGGNWGDHKVHTPPRVKYPKGTRGNPDKQAGAKADAISDATLDKYIYEFLQPGAPADNETTRALKARLVAAVDELISERAWMPYRFMGGKHPSDYLEFHTDPSETLEALAWAYPFLPDELQEKVKAYVRRDWMKLNPIWTVRELPSGEGEPREFHRVPDDHGRVFRMGRDRGFERAYVAWLWAQRTGEWRRVKQIWPTVQNAHRMRKPDPKRDSNNNHCALLIAVCRMAEHYKDRLRVKRTLPAAREALRERLRHELTYHRGYVVDQQINLWNGFVRWEYLTPEVGRMLAEQTEGTAPALVKHYLDWLRPYWPLQWGPLTPAAKENTVQLPHNTLSAFSAQAFIRGAPPAKLATWCDIPSCKADPYYIQKLGIALTYCSRPTWERE